MRGKGDVKAPGGGRKECANGHGFDAATDDLVRFEGGSNKPRPFRFSYGGAACARAAFCFSPVSDS